MNNGNSEQFEQDDPQEKKISVALLSVTFFSHLAWTLYASQTDAIPFIEEIKYKLSSIYSYIGLTWKGSGGYVITASLISALIVNSIRRILEGIFFGWPQFRSHNKQTLLIATIQLLFFTTISYFIIGIDGKKFSSRPLDIVDVILISIITYIIGKLVNFVDEIISATFSLFRGKKL